MAQNTESIRSKTVTYTVALYFICWSYILYMKSWPKLQVTSNNSCEISTVEYKVQYFPEMWWREKNEVTVSWDTSFKVWGQFLLEHGVLILKTIIQLNPRSILLWILLIKYIYITFRSFFTTRVYCSLSLKWQKYLQDSLPLINPNIGNHILKSLISILYFCTSDAVTFVCLILINLLLKKLLFFYIVIFFLVAAIFLLCYGLFSSTFVVLLNYCTTTFIRPSFYGTTPDERTHNDNIINLQWT